MRITLSKSVLSAAFIAFTFTSPIIIAAPAAAGAEVTCKDGSTSKAGRGACSHHGGVQKAAAAADASSTAPAAAAPVVTKAPAAVSKTSGAKATASAAAADTGADAQGATAKCKDGSYSHSKQHKGSCSHHGGVAQWLDK